MSAKEYEEDEFDRAAQDVPAGAHREPVSRKRLALPFLVAIIVGPLLAWGVVSLIQHTGVAASTTHTVTQSSESVQPPSSEPASSSSTPLPTESGVSKSQRAQAAVAVFNTSGQKGLAASVASKLQKAGYSKAAGDNGSGKGISETTVYYSSASLEPIARDVSQTLGISAVSARPQGWNIPEGVSVYLLSDYRG